MSEAFFVDDSILAPGLFATIPARFVRVCVGGGGGRGCKSFGILFIDYCSILG